MPKARRITLRGRYTGRSEPMDIHICGGIVEGLAPASRQPVDFGGPDAILGPTLVDIQVNGANGVNLQGGGLSIEDLRNITAFLARHGVARWVPTLVTAAPDEMEHGCTVIADAMKIPELRRAVPGVHLEGPCISPEDGPRGAHPKAHVCPPRIKDFDRLYKAANGHVVYTTVAPELRNAPAYIRSVVERGVKVSLGHHQADAAQIAAAVDAGATLCTHLGNGAAPQMHRHKNPLWPQLADDRLYASFIADRHHLPDDVLKVFARTKGPKRSILVSDCTHLVGMKPGKYTIFGGQVELKRDGKITIPGTDLLAGSALLLLQGVVNTWKVTDLTLPQAFACASRIPARALGIRATPPPFREGKRAEGIVFTVQENKNGWTPKIEAVFIGGRQTEQP